MLIMKSEWIRHQMNEAIRCGMIPTRDGHRIPVRFAYRCLYCGEWFSQTGAEKHFGRTRIDYWEGKLMGKDEQIEVMQFEPSGD